MIKEKFRPWVLSLTRLVDDTNRLEPYTYYENNSFMFVEIDMPDGTKEYYSTERDDPGFAFELARLIDAVYKDKAHLHALEKFLNANQPGEVKLWRGVLNHLNNGEVNAET